MSDKVTLSYDGKSIDLPLLKDVEGDRAIDISKLRAQTGLITMDVGFMNTGSCTSNITYIDGDKGILRYRGYPIEQLAERSSFQECAYMLYEGYLPLEPELNAFKKKVLDFGKVPNAVLNIIDQFTCDSHPMAVVSSAISALAGFYHDYLGPIYTEQQKKDALALMMAQMKIIIAAYYRKTIGKKPYQESHPSNLSFAGDFLNLMFNDGTYYSVDPQVANALNILLVLHADHEQNCSTSTVRVVGSSQANVFACIASGINALWGPLHGGANQAVLEMLQQIEHDGGDFKKWMNKAKDKDDPFRLMGFGHRVYKSFDPRATIIKKACDTVLNKLGVHDPLLEIAKGLEEIALADPYFVERNLYPNVDFYSGIIYRALGIPTNFFTVMFALGRLPGWMAQWKEMTETPNYKIARPRQLYMGPSIRDYKGLKEGRTGF
jgi:citrate synthase